jgi:hypothetical protein
MNLVQEFPFEKFFHRKHFLANPSALSLSSAKRMYSSLNVNIAEVLFQLKEYH